MPVEIAHVPRRDSQTGTALKMQKCGYSVMRLSREIGVNHAHVSNYLRGRRCKVGRRTRRAIRAKLLELGIVKQPTRRPPVCKYCGREYPTRPDKQESALAVHT